MSFQPNTNLYASPYTQNRIDDIQLYANLATIIALTDKYVDVIYRAIDTGNQYTWDGISLVFYNNVILGSVSSVSKTGNTIVVNNTNSANPIISTSQELNNTASPTFTAVSLTTGTISAAPILGNDIVNRTYADLKVASVVSGNSFLLDNSGTAINPILQNKIGANTPFLYECKSPLLNGSMMSFNSSASLTTQIGIGWLPVNRSSYLSIDYVKHQLEYLNTYFPFYLRIIDTTDETKYATYTVNSLLGTGAFSFSYGVSYNAPESSGTFSNVNGTKIHAIIEPISSGQINTGSNVGAGEGVFKAKVGVDLQFRTLTATSSKIVLSNNANDIGIDASITKSDVGLSNVPNLKQNLTGIATPTVNDDSLLGYAIGSRWFFGDRELTCTDATAGNARWFETTTQNAVLGTTNQVIATPGIFGSVVLSTPQNLNTTANITFNNLSLTTGSITTAPTTANHIVNKTYANNASNLSTGTASVGVGGTGQTTYTNGQLLIGNTTGNTLTNSTLTQSHGMNITNSTGSITLSSDMTLILTGAVVITPAGLLTLNTVSQTNRPYYTASNVMTIKTDVVIEGSLTLNGTSILIIEGDLIVNGSLVMSADSNLITRGSMLFRGLTGTDSVFIGSSNLIALLDITFRNYTYVGIGIYFGSFSQSTNITSRSLLFDNNDTSIGFVNEPNGYVITANDVIFQNCTSSNSAETLILLYRTTIKATNLKFTNNFYTPTSSVNNCISLELTDIFTSNLIEFDGNKISGTNNTGYTILIGEGAVLNADRCIFNNNSQEATTTSNHCIFMSNTGVGSSIASNNIELIDNDTKITGSSAFRLAGTLSKLKCEILQIKTLTSGGNFGNINNLDATIGNIQSQYSTGRLPQILIYNSGATLTNMAVSSSLGKIPFFQCSYEDWTVGTITTLTTQNTYYQVIPASITNSNNVPLSTQFTAGVSNGSIIYTGEDTEYFNLNLDISGSVSGAGEEYSLYVYKNNVPITTGNRYRFTGNNSPESIDISKILQLTKNDEIGIFITCLTSNNRTFKTGYYNLSLQKMSIM